MTLGYFKRVGGYAPGRPRTCPACNQIALVEVSPARFLCGNCRADYTKVGIQWLRNEDHVPVARLKD